VLELRAGFAKAMGSVNVKKTCIVSLSCWKIISDYRTSTANLCQENLCHTLIIFNQYHAMVQRLAIVILQKHLCKTFFNKLLIIIATKNSV